MAKLVLIRHGQSVWNLENRFTGWVDVPLSKKGMLEAKRAGKLLNTYKFDIAYTSSLIRAIETLYLIFAESQIHKVPIIHHQHGQLHDWEAYFGDKRKEIAVFEDISLDERYYGGLQGMNKDEMKKKFGEDKVKQWRRSYAIRPPHGESLKDTAKRTLPFFKKNILPAVMSGKNVLVAAHGNSLRSIIMFLDDLTPDEVVNLELATGVPIIYDLNSRGKVLSKKILKWKRAIHAD
jgi:2,3-bisphosphoglycerate-dependent phosphoglycerate mutase